MRLVPYDAGAGPTAGVLLGDEIAPAGASVRELLLAGASVRPRDERTALADVRLLPPAPDPDTGTPDGIGALKGTFLRDGDVVSVEVDGLGAVTNPVRAR
jgi:Fumarylacetoacetate (FAA) hydrolase family/Domain of unknown function (DUF2437)